MTGTEPHAWGTGLMDDIIFVGLDVHKATVCIAVAEGGRGGDVRQLGVFENRPEILNKVVSRLSKGGRRLSFCYEAGPCGYGLHRLLTGYGHECVVIAPSLIPMKAGDRVKTDRRDALMLAKLHRAGELLSRQLQHELARGEVVERPGVDPEQLRVAANLGQHRGLDLRIVAENRLEQVAYLGAAVQYQVRTGGGLTMSVLAGKTGSRFASGDSVVLAWAPSDALVLGDRSGTVEDAS